jgi:glyoxylase-like metal-dependent hydrolase (beta-lactamase superfamily II)
MYFEQFFLGCLAHDSYMLASEGQAVVVDPQRDVDIYLRAAEQHGVRIRHIFETHLHADFVSGHKELAARTGAAIYIGPNGGARIAHVEVHDGFELRLGTVTIKVLETPGHTPESICLVVTDQEKSRDPWAWTGEAPVTPPFESSASRSPAIPSQAALASSSSSSQSSCGPATGSA